MADPIKKLRLTIEIDGIWADDLDESAAIYSDPDPPDAQARLDVVLEEWMRPEVILTIVTLPGEKCLNREFEVLPYRGVIVGAETVDRG